MMRVENKCHSPDSGWFDLLILKRGLLAVAADTWVESGDEGKMRFSRGEAVFNGGKICKETTYVAEVELD